MTKAKKKLVFVLNNNKNGQRSGWQQQQTKNKATVEGKNEQFFV